MELINGDVDLDANLTIENHSKRDTIYAIGSQADDNEPLWLIVDDSVKDGTFELKYASEDEEEDIEVKVPAESEIVQV